MLGPVSHFLGDLTPHEDIPSDVFEGVSGLLAGALGRPPARALLAGDDRRVFATLPDFEHLLRPARPGRRQLFPTHRYARLHQRGGLPAWLQLGAAVAILVALDRD